MIVNYNVCDQCGNQNEIQSGSLGSGIDVTFAIIPTYQTIENRGGFVRDKQKNGTFCDKECMIEWFKANISHAGVIKLQEHEKDDDAPF